MVKIVIPTPLSEEDYKSSRFYRCLLKSIGDDECEIQIVANNKTGLSALYSEIIETSEEDIITFMHDDVEVHDCFLIDKIKKAHERFDIVGLAGSRVQDYSMHDFPAWHLVTPRDQMRGVVSHMMVSGDASFVNTSFYGPCPDQVVVIDGLFMSFKRDKIKTQNLFNSDYTFHFYDMNTCLQANKKGISIGVWPIFVIHYGLGEFQNDKLWNKLKIKFDNEYKLATFKV